MCVQLGDLAVAIKGSKATSLKFAVALLLAFPVTMFGQEMVAKKAAPETDDVPYSSSKGNPKQQKKQEIAQAAPVTTASAELDETYRIGVEDELQVTVWREPELSASVAVRPDGVISLPLLDEVPVVGMTTKELAENLTKRLRAYVAEPQVTVVARQIRSRKVYLVGAVGRPGSYPLNGRKTVLQLLAEAGGPGQFAKVKSIYVVRDINGKRMKLPFNYKKALAGNDVDSDVILAPGDMIVVP
jgi:polysaccharide export outer membrane protein